jgi:NADPH-dependent 2,4-dienoyl-CoA reductase/sulfur reductase-like enzyme
MTENTDVVVIGGGYAGVMAANRLTQRDDVTVTLINPRAKFVERMRLHQSRAGSDDAVVDTATRINAAGRSVTLATDSIVGDDYLIYAVGSGSARPSVPGAAEFAYPTSTCRTHSGCGRSSPEGTTLEVIEANGLPALLIRIRGQVVGVLTLEVEGDFIRTIRNVANPDKLAHLNLPPTSAQERRLRA